MTENRYEFQANEVVKLNLTTAVVPMTVREVEGTDQVVIYVKADEELTYQCKLEQGKVKLKFDDIHIDKKDRWDELKESDQKIEVELPKDLYLEKFKVSVAAGEVHVDLPSLKTEKAAFEVGAGKVFVDNLSALRKASFEIGAGSAEMTDLVFTQDTEVVLECGVGKVDMATNGLGNYKIDCGLGKVNVDLDDFINYFAFDVSSGIGKVSINGKRIGRLFAASESFSSEESNRKVSINCGLGSVKVNTRHS